MSLTTSAAAEPLAESELRRRRWIAMALAPAVLAVMYPVFQITTRLFGDRAEGYLGWAAGLLVYWLLWCLLVPRFLLGTRGMWSLLRPRPAGLVTLALAAVPLAIVLFNRFALGGDPYHWSSWPVLALLVGTAFGNGVFEELLWRGVYLRLFERRLFRVAWPSLWFGMWHLAPGGLSASGAVLAVGAVFLGLYQALLARRTGGVWWPAVAHLMIGLVMVA